MLTPVLLGLGILSALLLVVVWAIDWPAGWRHERERKRRARERKHLHDEAMQKFKDPG
jgi:hypothetical protein